MSGFFFSGSHVVKLDEKGRFVLPQEMRYGLVEEGKCEFVIGLGLGGCLAIYRKSLIQQIVDKFRENQHVARFQKFFTLFFSTLHQTEHDKIGRVMLPANLKSAIGIEKEMVVAGVMDKIELWPKEVYDRNLRALLEGKSADMSLERMTEEAFLLLHEGDAPEAVSVEETVAAAIHRNNLKNREFDKEAPQNSCPERVTIAERQGTGEDENSEGKPTRSKTDSSSCFGINPAYIKE